MSESSLIRSDLRRMLISPRLYISICGGLVILLRPLFSALTQKVDGTLMQFVSTPFGASDFSPFAVIFCVLPFANSFCDDYISGHFINAVLRTGAKKYSRQRCLTVALSGGISMALIVLVTISICALLANQPETEETTQFMHRTIWAQMDVILKYNGIIHMALRVLLGFLFGSLWALVGLSISTLVANRFVTYIAPFVLYQALWFLLDGNAFNPVYMLRGDSNVIPSLWFVLWYQFMSISIFYIFSFYGIRKKVRI